MVVDHADGAHALEPPNTVASSSADAGDFSAERLLPMHNQPVNDSTSTVLAQEVRRLTVRLRQQERQIARSQGHESEKNPTSFEKCSHNTPAPHVEKNLSEDGKFEIRTANARIAEARADAAALRREVIRVSLNSRQQNLATFRARKCVDTARDGVKNLSSTIDELVLQHQDEKSSLDTRVKEATRQAEEAVKEAQDYRNQVNKLRSDLEAAQASVASLTKDLRVSEGEANSWRKKAELAEEKFANALVEMRDGTKHSDGAGQVTPTRRPRGFGPMFSPAPLAMSSLNNMDEAVGEDLASESRSRYTGTLPFNLDAYSDSPSPQKVTKSKSNTAKPGNMPAKRPRGRPPSREGRAIIDSYGSAVATSRRGGNISKGKDAGAARSHPLRTTKSARPDVEKNDDDSNVHNDSAEETVSEEDPEIPGPSHEILSSRATLHKRSQQDIPESDLQRKESGIRKRAKVSVIGAALRQDDSLPDRRTSPPRKRGRKSARPTSLMSPDSSTSHTEVDGDGDGPKQKEDPGANYQGENRDSGGRSMRRRKAISYNYDEPGRDVVGGLDGINFKIRRQPTPRKRATASHGVGRKQAAAN